jgi:hypothetical protein
MSSIVIAGDTSGSVTLQAPAVSGSTVLNLPATSGTIQASGAGYTTNGVAYATSATGLVTGSALTFDGTFLNANGLRISGSDTSNTVYQGTGALGITCDGPSINIGANNASGFTTFSIASSEKMRLTSTGLGIGTTSPDAKLDVTSAGTASTYTVSAVIQDGTYPASGNPTLEFNGFIGGNGYRAGIGSIGGQQLAFYTPSTFGVAPTRQMTLNESGNLGVGTTSPSQRIHASAADPRALLASTGTGHSAWQCQNTSGSSYFGRDNAGGSFFGTSNATVVYSSSADPIIFYTNATERARIDSSGNLLVGTTSSFSARLGVKDSTSNGTTSPIVCKNSSDTTLFYVSSNGYFVTGTGGNSPYNLTTASASNVTIESDGVLKRSTSSLKYKTDVKDATHGLAEVLQLRPVTYKGKNDGNKVFGGLIAEEIHEVGLTEFVQYAEDGTPDALAYGNMVSLCVKAIQEQQALITQLTERITALEAK